MVRILELQKKNIHEPKIKIVYLIHYVTKIFFLFIILQCMISMFIIGILQKMLVNIKIVIKSRMLLPFYLIRFWPNICVPCLSIARSKINY